MAKARHSRFPSRKSNSSTMIFTMLLMFTFVILILLALGILSIPSNSVGSRKAHDLSTIVHNQADSSIEDEGKPEPWVEVISWEPRAFVYHNFLSKDECEYLISLAKPHMVKSTVVDSETGKSKDSRVRTSSGTFLARGRDKVVRDIEQRIADFSFIPVDHGEGLQILHYEVGQKYEPHYNGGQRIATVLMYLSDVEEGGETVFPNAKGNYRQKGLSVKPKMGDALLFWSMNPDASLDPSSLHG
ncbi:Probable prolyl 4-hydroxylase 10 [Linum perenne]